MRKARGLFLFGGLAVGAFSGLWAQVPKEQEDAVIASYRKGAKPRKVAPGDGLTTLDLQRAKVFRAARASVVFLNASTRRYVIQDERTGDVFRVPPGTGTGFVWDDLGHVVTNHHILNLADPSRGLQDSAEQLEVTLADGRSYKARLIGRSLEYDVAVLHVFAPLKALRPLPLGTSRNLVVGQSVLAIGNPFGLDHTLTGGIISALDRQLVTESGTVIPGVIQTDAAINPGNSGGPLLDGSGRLIGMNTAIAKATGASVGIGFAIPVDTLNRVVPQLIAKGNVDRPVLGFATLRRELAFRFFGIEKGTVVRLVEPGSPAERAGLRGIRMPASETEAPVLGDIIVGLHGKPVDSDVQLYDRLALLPPLEPLELEVVRDGRRIKLTIRPGAPTASGGFL